MSKANDTYDARIDGADCDNCPLSEFKPICAEKPRRRALAIVGEGPGRAEYAMDRDFAGATGKEIDNFLRVHGMSRKDVHVNNATRCWPRGKKLTPSEWKQAVIACRPRLDKELKAARPKAILALGRKAMMSVTGETGIMKNWVGSWMQTRKELGRKVVIPTFHPAYAMRKQSHLFPVIAIHSKRALQASKGVIEPFKWRITSYGDGPQKTLRALRRIAKGNLIAWDIETAGASAYAPMTAIGFANAREGASIALRGGLKSKYPAKIAAEILEIIRRILSSKTVEKIGHNSSHDVIGCEAIGWKVQGTIHDTLLAHYACAPSDNHGLQYAFLEEFAADAWKTKFKVTDDAKGSEAFLKASDEDLTAYNAKDALATAMLWNALKQRMNAADFDAWAHYYDRLELSVIARDMYARGLTINTSELRRLASYTKGQGTKVMNLIQGVAKWAGWPDKNFNPSSPQQLQELYFDLLGVTPIRYSEKTDLPSLDKKVMEKYMVHTDPVVRDLSFLITKYRVWRKLYGMLRKFPKREGAKAFPVPKVWGTANGRWAYSDKETGLSPQTIPSGSIIRHKGQKAIRRPGIRSIIRTSKPWLWFLEADYAQVESRIIAYLANDDALLETFARGGDIHSDNARALFGDNFDSTMRRMAKIFQFATNYRAGTQTIWMQLVSAGFQVEFSLVEQLHRKWFQIHRPIQVWQDLQVRLAKERDYTEGPLSGRRVYFYGERYVDAAFCANKPIQDSAAYLIDEALKKIDREFRSLDNGTALLLQVHDALILETPTPVKAARILKKHMEAPVDIGDHKNVVFPIDFKLGRMSKDGISNWGDTVSCDTPQDIAKAVRKMKAA